MTNDDDRSGQLFQLQALLATANDTTRRAAAKALIVTVHNADDILAVLAVRRQFDWSVLVKQGHLRPNSRSTQDQKARHRRSDRGARRCSSARRRQRRRRLVAAAVRA